MVALAILSSFGLIGLSWGYHYPSAIQYTQYLTTVIRESQVDGWPVGDEHAKRYITDVGVSADGSRIAFRVAVGLFNHLYVCQADGLSLQDLTSNFSETFRYLPIELNDGGTRVFCGQGEDVSYCDLSQTPACYLAVYDGILNYDDRKPYSINTDGSIIFFKHDAGWDPVNSRYHRGLFYATVPGTPVKIMDIDQLPCDSECGNMSMLAFLGASTDSAALLFAYNRHYYVSPATGMWTVPYGGNPVEVPPEEHDYVWSIQNINNRIIDAHGTRALYHFADGLSNEIHAVTLANGEKRFIASGSPDRWVALSPDGTYARLSTANHNTTRVNLDVNPISKRDTGSYYIEEFSCGYHLSDLTADNRCYYMSGSCPTGPSKIYRVDMNPTETGSAPDISDIRFSASALLHTEEARITVTARVFDPEVSDGEETIEWVKLFTLVEGKESPDWPMARPPLAFPFGDPAFTQLYDDGEPGEHGDLLAGNGVYTFDQIATRKGGYDNEKNQAGLDSFPHGLFLPSGILWQQSRPDRTDRHPGRWGKPQSGHRRVRQGVGLGRGRFRAVG
jgi:hypothetical protein